MSPNFPADLRKECSFLKIWVHQWEPLTLKHLPDKASGRGDQLSQKMCLSLLFSLSSFRILYLSNTWKHQHEITKLEGPILFYIVRNTLIIIVSHCLRQEKCSFYKIWQINEIAHQQRLGIYSLVHLVIHINSILRSI